MQHLCRKGVSLPAATSVDQFGSRKHERYVARVPPIATGSFDCISKASIPSTEDLYSSRAQWASLFASGALIKRCCDKTEFSPRSRQRQRAHHRNKCRVTCQATADTVSVIDEPVTDDVSMAAAGSGASNAVHNDGLIDIIQFDAAIYYAIQTEPVMKIDVIRMGTFKGECSVDYYTTDGSAEAGVRYSSVRGTLVFKDGVTFQTVKVPILDDGRWNPTLEFGIAIENPQHCELGRFLYRARVKVIDTDFFPTSQYAEEMKEHGVENVEEKAGVTGIDLFLEYVKLNLTYDEIPMKSIATLGIDQLQNLYLLLTTYLVQYVADDVLGKGGNDLIIANSRESTLLVAAAIYLVPNGILNVLDLWKSQLGLAETSRQMLQKNIMTKFMNYSEDSRSKVSSSEMCLVMVQDVNEVVNSGFMNLFQLAKNAGKLAVSSYFIVSESPDATGPLVVFGLASGLYIASSYKENAQIRDEVSDQETEIVDVVQEGSAKYRLFADYFIRPQLLDTLRRKIASLSEASKPVALSEVTSEYVPVWLSTLLVTGWLVYGGGQVLDGSIQVGNYLATVNVFKSVGETFKDIFTVTLEFSKAIGPIKQITSVLNLPTSLRNLKTVNRARRRLTKKNRAPDNLKRLRQLTGQRYGTDGIPIEVISLGFYYGDNNDNSILHDVNLTANQGSFVTIVGERSGGKTTFIQLLGQVLIPTKGFIYVPSYLRILHVSDDPMMLKSSLWTNLTVGKSYWVDQAFETERVLKICRRIGLSEFAMEVLTITKKDFESNNVEALEDSSWVGRMTKTDLQLIHLARAFIYSPEVLVMNQPTRNLSDTSAEMVLDLIREFCDERGVELPAGGKAKRRPRTAFISTVRMSAVNLCDVIWEVRDRSVREISADEVSLDTLSSDRGSTI